jgi:hypothetical protein
MILADSIRQTASMALCVLVAVTATHHTIFNPLAQVRPHRSYFFAAIQTRDGSYSLGAQPCGPNISRTSVSPSHPGQCFL